MTYQDYDWLGMLNDGTLSKQTGAVLDKYVQYHRLKTHPLKNDYDNSCRVATCTRSGRRATRFPL